MIIIMIMILSGDGKREAARGPTRKGEDSKAHKRRMSIVHNAQTDRLQIYSNKALGTSSEQAVNEDIDSTARGVNCRRAKRQRTPAV